LPGGLLEQPDWLVAARRRPRFRGVLHQYAFFAALVFGALLVAFAEGGIARISAFVFALSVAVMLGVSALYHRIIWPPGPRRWIRRLDHAAIFLLIAGTYTPYCLLVLGGAWGWTLFAVIWSIAAFGIVFKIFHTNRYARLSLMLYLATGWVGVLAAGPIIANMETTGLLLLALGGLAYTGGVAFFVWESMPFNHAVWHLFVLAGSTCHFLSIYYYVAQGAITA
jgi:hemolysin III